MFDGLRYMSELNMKITAKSEILQYWCATSDTLLKDNVQYTIRMFPEESSFLFACCEAPS